MSSKQLTYGDVSTGMSVPPLVIGPWTTSHIVRWCAAQENWERHHTDYKYATIHEGLRDVVANGNWRKYVVARLLKDWLGHGGWLWRLMMRYTGLHFPGDVFNVWAKVTKKYEMDGLGFVDLEGGMRNQEGKETTPMTAVVVVPLKEGKEVPYPFVPPPGLHYESPFPKGTVCEAPKFVTDEAKRYIGREADELEAVDEVCKSELRRFAQAIPDPDPIYWDEEYARRTRFGTLVAPPLFPVDAFKPAPHLPDRLTEELRKAPYFWGGPPGDYRLYVEVPLGTTHAHFNGGQEYEIFRYAKLGDRLRAKRRVVDLYEKEGKTFGRLVFEEDLTTYRDSKGDVIMKERALTINR